MLQASDIVADSTYIGVWLAVDFYRAAWNADAV